MYTIIKVKRKLGNDPADCLIIESKKKKLDSTESESIQKEVLKYAGSASNEIEITERVKELNQRIRSKENLKRDFRQPKQSNLKEDLLKEQKKDVQSQRYFLVNSKRGIGNANVIDVISSEEKGTNTAESDEIICNGEKLIKEKVNSNKYTYDLYYTKNYDFQLDSLLNNCIIKAGDFNEILVNDEDLQDDEELHADDDDDSNDENNWRNEYPDDDQSGNSNADDEYYDDNYANDYEDFGLSSMMKKSLNVDYYDNDCDSDDDDCEEYLNDFETKRSYNFFKKKVLKELGDDV